MKMKKLFILPIFLLSLISCSSEIESEIEGKTDSVVERGGLYYEEFSETPFTGKVTGKEQGRIKDGKKEGEWVGYWGNGQLMSKVSYKNGKEEGEWVGYHGNGQLSSKGSYKNGLWEGDWVEYYGDGTLYKRGTGTFKNGEKVSD